MTAAPQPATKPPAPLTYATPKLPGGSKPPSSGGAGGWRKLLWPLITLVTLLAFNALFTPNFMSVSVRDGRITSSLVDVLNRAVPTALTGIGMTLVIATGGVDLSVGALIAISGAVAAAIAVRDAAPLPLVVSVALGVSLLCGAWNGLLVAVFRIQPIVATLILMVAGRGIAQLVTDGQIITFHHAGLTFIGKGYFLGLPLSVTIVALVLIATVALVRLTALGLFIESVGDNETASRFAGLNDRFIKFAVYAFSGLCAGIGGLIAAGNIQAADANNAGQNLELNAILAAVIGGTALTGGRFYLLGTILGALIIQTLTTTILTRGVPVQWTLVVKAIVVLAVCLLQAPRVQRQMSQLMGRLRAGRDGRAA